jgi:hypothetical protein
MQEARDNPRRSIVPAEQYGMTLYKSVLGKVFGTSAIDFMLD